MASLDQQEAAAAATATEPKTAAGPKTALSAGEPICGSRVGQNSATAAAAAAASVGKGAGGELPGDSPKRERAVAAADTAMVETMAEVRCMRACVVCAEQD